MAESARPVRRIKIPSCAVLIAILTLVIGQSGPAGQATFTFERVSGTSGSAPPPTRGETNAAGISADGRFVLLNSWAPEHQGDPNASPGNVWIIRDRVSGGTTAPIPGIPGPGFLSGSDSQVVLSADGSSMAVADGLGAGALELREFNGTVVWGPSSFASGQNLIEGATNLSLSANGRMLAFSGSFENSCTPPGGDSQVYVLDLDSGDPCAFLVSVFEEENEPGNDNSYYPALSGNGNWLAFVSNATDLLEDGDTNDGMADLFLMNFTTGEVRKVAPIGPEATPMRFSPLIPWLSHDGGLLTFTSAEQLDGADTNADLDVYTYDTAAGTFSCVSCALTSGTGNEAQFAATSGAGSVVTFGVGPAGSGVPDRVYRFDRSSSGLLAVAQTLASLPSFQTEDGCGIALTSYVDGLTSGDANEVGDAIVATLAGCGGSTDVTPPLITCAAADGVWHAANVTLTCTAADADSGLDNPADASFTLTTNVAPGQESANAFTDSNTVCDLAGNCAVAQVGGNMIDLRAPAVSVVTPGTNAIFTLGQVVLASYNCPDGGSGLASCSGPVASGQALDTATLGAKNFPVTGTDNVGNSTTVSIPYLVVTPTSGPTVAGLIQQVAALALRPAVHRLLTTTLRSAEQAIAQGRLVVARALLRAFEAEVRLLIRAGTVPAAVGNNLISQAQAIIAGL
jgi:hypothetical protein